jgi:hypothetical protein
MASGQLQALATSRLTGYKPAVQEGGGAPEPFSTPWTRGTAGN